MFVLLKFHCWCKLKPISVEDLVGRAWASIPDSLLRFFNLLRSLREAMLQPTVVLKENLGVFTRPKANEELTYSAPVKRCGVELWATKPEDDLRRLAVQRLVGLQPLVWLRLRVFMPYPSLACRTLLNLFRALDLSVWSWTKFHPFNLERKPDTELLGIKLLSELKKTYKTIMCTPKFLTAWWYYKCSDAVYALVLKNNKYVDTIACKPRTCLLQDPLPRLPVNFGAITLLVLNISVKV